MKLERKHAKIYVHSSLCPRDDERFVNGSKIILSKGDRVVRYTSYHM